jgi:hypothetical protein
MCRVGFDFASLSYYGLAFDTTAILYVNLLFIVLSIFPLWKTLVKDIKSFSFTFISDLIYIHAELHRFYLLQIYLR